MVYNPYPGVNAHLNSALLQPRGAWESFHAEHIGELRRGISAVLPTGYYAALERSQQVTVALPEDDNGKPIRTRPDAAVYSRTQSPVQTGQVPAPNATAVLEVDNVFDEADPEQWAASVNIYRFSEPATGARLITRVELLSPANKPGGGHYPVYMLRRSQTLQSGVNLVEVDYLHTTSPILDHVPSYKHQQVTSTPYHVLVSRPQVNTSRSLVDYYAVRIDEALPDIYVPLVGGEGVTLSLQAVYEATLATNRHYWSEFIRYTQPPADFHRYTPDDQARILALMQGFRHDA